VQELKRKQTTNPLVILSVIIVLFTASAFSSIETQTDNTPVQEPNKFIILTPTCLDRSNIPDSEMHWLYMPSSPDELYTQENYGFLAGELIKNGIVDASDCPLNGLWANGYANACGLEKARDVSIELQNLYNDEILEAGRNIGVPPVMLKQLIRYESQFWPVRWGPYHFGLSHLTYPGADTGLRWSYDLYQEVCQQVYGAPCTGTFFSQSPSVKNMLAGYLLGMMDATCENCPYMFDEAKAQASVEYIAQTLLSHCQQVHQIIYNVTGQHSSYVVSYPTIWKLTLVNYNAGPHCIYDAVTAAYTGTSLDYDQIATEFPDGGCLDGANYSYYITAPYFSFP
jgi:hypothetical protein